MFRDCHFRPRNHCRKILINREIKIDSLSIQANCNCSNIICSVILALSVYTLATLRDGHYFIDEGGGGVRPSGNYKKKSCTGKTGEKYWTKGPTGTQKKYVVWIEKYILYNLRLQKYCYSGKLPTPLPSSTHSYRMASKDLVTSASKRRKFNGNRRVCH